MNQADVLAAAQGRVLDLAHRPRAIVEIEVDIAGLEFHRLNPPETGRAFGSIFEIRARLANDAVDLLAEVKRLRAKP